MCCMGGPEHHLPLPRTLGVSPEQGPKGGGSIMSPIVNDTLPSPQLSSCLVQPQPSHWMERGPTATHPFEVAHGLEVDEISLLGLQRWVPVATVGLVVPDGEGFGFSEAAGGQLSPKVVHGATGHGIIEGEWHREAFLPTQLPLELLGPLFFHNDLVGAGDQAQVSSVKNRALPFPWSPSSHAVPPCLWGSHPHTAPTYLMGAPLPCAGRSSTVMVLSDSLSGDGMSP